MLNEWILTRWIVDCPKYLQAEPLRRGSWFYLSYKVTIKVHGNQSFCKERTGEHSVAYGQGRLPVMRRPVTSFWLGDIAPKGSFHVGWKVDQYIQHLPTTNVCFLQWYYRFLLAFMQRRSGGGGGSSLTSTPGVSYKTIPCLFSTEIRIIGVPGGKRRSCRQKVFHAMKKR